MESVDNTTVDIKTENKLNNKWTLYLYQNDRTKSWIENFRKVCEICTVEDFWGVMNHLAPPSSLSTGSDYYFFRDEISPTWESPENEEGGAWIATFDKSLRNTHLDSCWLEILLILIGNTLDESEYINGCVVNMRAKRDRLNLWTSITTPGDIIRNIGASMKSSLKLDFQIDFNSHVDAAKKATSYFPPSLYKI